MSRWISDVSDGPSPRYTALRKPNIPRKGMDSFWHESLVLRANRRGAVRCDAMWRDSLSGRSHSIPRKGKYIWIVGEEQILFVCTRRKLEPNLGSMANKPCREFMIRIIWVGIPWTYTQSDVNMCMGSSRGWEERSKSLSFIPILVFGMWLRNVSCPRVYEITEYSSLSRSTLEILYYCTP